MTPLTFRLEPVPGGHGADDYEDDEGDAYTLRASGGIAAAGSLDFNLKAGPTIWIRWIEVPPELRRQGIARALLAEARRRFPGAEVDTGGFTDEGEAWWLGL